MKDQAYVTTYIRDHSKSSDKIQTQERSVSTVRARLGYVHSTFVQKHTYFPIVYCTVHSIVGIGPRSLSCRRSSPAGELQKSSSAACRVGMPLITWIAPFKKHVFHSFTIPLDMTKNQHERGRRVYGMPVMWLQEEQEILWPPSRACMNAADFHWSRPRSEQRNSAVVHTRTRCLKDSWQAVPRYPKGVRKYEMRPHQTIDDASRRPTRHTQSRVAWKPTSGLRRCGPTVS